jgi:hypothetical protein
VFTARIWNVAGTLAKTGIMIRESLTPDAKMLIMKLGDVGGREAGFGTRSTTGGYVRWLRGNDYTWLPAWFRLQRSGNDFTAFESSDGVTWFAVGTSTVAMDSTFYVGLAACSGSTTGALDNTTFDNVTVIDKNTDTTNAGNTTNTSAVANDVTIYPNPVRDQLTIRLANQYLNGVVITLYDVTGRIITSVPVTGAQYILDCSTLSRATYFMIINNGVASIAREIIKQ